MMAPKSKILFAIALEMEDKISTFSSTSVLPGASSLSVWPVMLIPTPGEIISSTAVTGTGPSSCVTEPELFEEFRRVLRDPGLNDWPGLFVDAGDPGLMTSEVNCSKVALSWQLFIAD